MTVADRIEILRAQVPGVTAAGLSKTADNDELIKRISTEHGIPLPVVNTFAAISATKNAHLFSMEAAIKAFSEVGKKYEPLKVQTHEEFFEEVTKSVEDGHTGRRTLPITSISFESEDVKQDWIAHQRKERLGNILKPVIVILMALVVVAGVVAILYEVLKR